MFYFFYFFLTQFQGMAYWAVSLAFSRNTELLLCVGPSMCLEGDNKQGSLRGRSQNLAGDFSVSFVASHGTDIWRTEHVSPLVPWIIEKK